MTDYSPNKYTALVTSEHASKPNFMAMVREGTAPYVAMQEAMASLVPAFDLDTAEGVQLDAIGVRVGISRTVLVPIQGPVILDQEPYRLLLRAKIAANQWDGTVPSAVAIYAELFPSLLIVVQDNQDMSLYVGIAGQIPDALTQTLLLNGYLPLKPQGVRQTSVLTTVNDTPLFGLDVENQYVSGFDVGACDIELTFDTISSVAQESLPTGVFGVTNFGESVFAP